MTAASIGFIGLGKMGAVMAPGAMALQRVEALLMAWLRWVILWAVHLQWAATRWEMLWVVPRWAVLRWVIQGLLHLLLMEQWLLWIPQRLRIWLKAWKQLIQLLTPPKQRQLMPLQMTLLPMTSCN